MVRLIHLLSLIAALFFSGRAQAQFVFEPLPLPNGGGGVPYTLVKVGNRLFKTGANVIDYSENNGLFWISCTLPPGTWSCLPHVSAEGRLYTADYGHLYYSDDLAATWDSLAWPYAVEQHPKAIFAVSSDLLFAFSGTDVYKTVDGGLHWESVFTFSNEPVVEPVELFAIPNSSTFLLRVPRFQTNVVYRSTDKGQNWTAVLTVGSNGEGKLSRSESGTLFLNGPQNNYWRSTDKGLNWKPMKMGTEHLAEAFSIASIGPVANKRVWGSTLGGVYLSENDGLTWTKTNLDLNNYGANALRFLFHPGAGLFASKGLFEQGSLYRSVDNGDTWSFASGGIKCGFFYDVVFASEHELVVNSTDGLFKTVNNGLSWAHIFKTDPSDALCQLQKGKGDHLFVVWKKKLFHSLDGGVVWTERSLPMDLYNYYNFKVNPFNDVIYLFAQNKTYASTDFGANWSAFDPQQRVVDFYFYPDGATEVQAFDIQSNRYKIYALNNDLTFGTLVGALPYGINSNFAPRMNVGQNGFRCVLAAGESFFSNNGGRTWSPQPSPFSSGVYPENAEINANNQLFVLDEDNNGIDKKFWYSLDKGATWSDLNAPPLEYGPAKLRLSPEGRLHLLGYKGLLYRTVLPTTAVASPGTEAGRVVVYPNPFSNSVYFDFSGMDLPLGAQFQLFDVFGRRLYGEGVTSSPFVYEAPQLSKGVYYCRFLASEGRTIWSGRLVKGR